MELAGDSCPSGRIAVPLRRLLLNPTRHGASERFARVDVVSTRVRQGAERSRPINEQRMRDTTRKLLADFDLLGTLREEFFGPTQSPFFCRVSFFYPGF